MPTARHRYGQKGGTQVKHLWNRRLRALQRFDEAAAIAAPRVELSADKQAVVEGCGGVLCCGETLVRLSCGPLVLELAGSALCLNHLSDSRVCVSGSLTALRFVSA
jgi:hypothetical protein